MTEMDGASSSRARLCLSRTSSGRDMSPRALRYRGGFIRPKEGLGDVMTNYWRFLRKERLHCGNPESGFVRGAATE